MRTTSELNVVNWNINSVRARLDALDHLITSSNPDILMLQEIKCQNTQFPHDIAENHRYNMSINGIKSYNGVAILSKFPIEEVKTSFPDNPCPEQGRFIQCSCLTDIGYVTFIAVYVPNGVEAGHEKFVLKLEFLRALKNYLQELQAAGERLVVGGDFNVAPFAIDVYSENDLQNSLCFTTQERQAMLGILGSGFVDCYRLLHPSTKQFSWWDYRAGAFQRDLGMRIDFILATYNMADYLALAGVDMNTRKLPKTSDHAPVYATFRK